MGTFIKTQNTFANGEVAPEFYTHDGINGLSKLENMDVLSGGGLRRRNGLVHLAAINSDARLVAFSVAEDEDYLLIMTDGHILIYNGATMVRDLISPWNITALPRLQYAQRFGTMIFTHPDFQPRILQKTGTDFELLPFDFARNNENMDAFIPFMHFDDADGVKITVTTNSAGSNFATFTTNQDFWTDTCVGDRLYLLDKQWIIDEYISSTVVRAYTNGTYSLPSSAVSDWFEAAFGNRRGWPCSITFHQDRLVFGGSRGYPGGVWLSKVGAHNNFDVGTGLDDEAIFITLLSQQRQQISTVVSSDKLQILTTTGEWAISSNPLTPSSVDIHQHTSVGSVTSIYLPPQKIEGATVFVSATKKDIRELSLDELGEYYNATDLCQYAKHLMTNPVDIAYNAQTRQLFVVMADGKIAVLNQNSSLGISAWATYITQGEFKSVAVIDGRTYVVVSRTDGVSIEYFDIDTLDDADRYGFAFRASALPLRSSGHSATKLRVRKITARVLDTKSLYINGYRVSLPNDIYDLSHPGFSGDTTVNLLGTMHDCINSPWTLHGSASMPVTILSVTMYGYYTV